MNVYAAYCRVSTEEQAKNETVAGQIEHIKSHCQINHITIPVDNWYIDDGFTGAASLRDRPSGANLLLDAMSGKFTHLIVVRVDRLAREDYVAQEAYHLLKKCGVNLISLSEPFDYFEPSGQMMATVFSSFASYDRAVIKQRFLDGKIANAQKGKLPQGTIPFGYKLSSNRTVEISPEQAETIRMIYKLYTEDGMSIRAITQYLTSLNIPSPGSFKQSWYPNSSDWCEFTVTKLLNADYYATGLYHFKPPQKQVIDVPVPPIIDKSIYDLARQIAIKKRQEYAPNGQYRDYLLRSFIKCGICGSTYVGTSNGRGRFSYYRCTKKIKRPNGAVCNNSQINASLIEAIVWDDLKKIFNDPQKLVEEISQQLEVVVEEHSDDRTELEAIEQQYQSLTLEKKRLLDLYAKGLTSETDLLVALKEREEALESLQKRRNYLNKIFDLNKSQEADIQGILDVADEIQIILNDADDKMKRDLFEMLLDHIEIYPGENGKGSKINVFYKIGLDTFNTFSVVK